jgi:hypothetical protein
LSSIRQGSLQYISTSYLIGFIVIIRTGIPTLYLYLISHWFYCHKSDRNLYTISLPIISSVLSSRITSYLIRAIIFPYYVSCRILNFPIDVIILYHMPYQILITCTRRLLSSNAVITWLSGRNHSSSPLVFSGVRVAQSLVFYVVFCRSLFVRLSFFHVIHCIYCLSLFNLRLLITPFVSSNSNSLMLSSHITWITTFYFIRVIILYHVTYHILFHRSYHLISRDLPHPISSELSSCITWLTTSYFIRVITTVVIAITSIWTRNPVTVVTCKCTCKKCSCI